MTVTRLSDQADPVPDEVWEEAARRYNEQELGALVLAIGLVNLWNRINVSTKQVPGADRILATPAGSPGAKGIFRTQQRNRRTRSAASPDQLRSGQSSTTLTDTVTVVADATV